MIEILLDIRDELSQLNSNVIDVETSADKVRKAIYDLSGPLSRR